MARAVTVTQGQDSGTSEPRVVRKGGVHMIVISGTIASGLGEGVHLEFDFGSPDGFDDVFRYTESTTPSTPVLAITQAAMDSLPSGKIVATQRLPAGRYRCRIEGSGSSNVTMRLHPAG